jgi:hypothetical protein
LGECLLSSAAHSSLFGDNALGSPGVSRETARR